MRVIINFLTNKYAGRGEFGDLYPPALSLDRRDSNFMNHNTHPSIGLVRP